MTTTEIRIQSLEKPGFVRLACACTRCGGAGGFRGWPGFTCFRCGGDGRDPMGQRTYAYPAAWTDEQINEHAAKRQAAATKRAETKAAKLAAQAEAAVVAFAATHPAEAAALEANVTGNEFLADLATKLRRFGELSAKQIAAILPAVERDQARTARAEAEEAAQAPVPTGKAITVEGEVVHVKVQDSQWGSVLKMLVVGEGWKVWSTVPSGTEALAPVEGEPNVRVRFVADVEASRDDETFGIAKRPRKLEVL